MKSTKLLFLIVMISLVLVGCKENEAKVESLKPDSNAVQVTNDKIAFLKDLKVYIKNADGTEERKLTDRDAINVCLVENKVYYMTAELGEGIYSVSLDGSNDEKVCELNEMKELSANTRVTSVYKDGFIYYNLSKLKEIGDTNKYPDEIYKLDIVNKKILKNNSMVQPKTKVKDENPIKGSWLGTTSDVGYFEFTDGEFKWYKDQGNKDDNYYFGTYSYTAGALRNNGKYDYGEENKEIYTITMKYQGFKIDGTITKKESDGALTIQRIGQKDKLSVKNHRTDGTFELNKVD